LPDKQEEQAVAQGRGIDTQRIVENWV
jgi:hypothetical protein